MSPGMVCYAGKQENLFWFSSLGQMVQFDTIIFGLNFCRTILVSSCGLKKVTVIVAFHFMTALTKKYPVYRSAACKIPALLTRVGLYIIFRALCNFKQTGGY